MRGIRRWRSGGIGGQPDWHFLRQKSWKPLRCQPMNTKAAEATGRRSGRTTVTNSYRQESPDAMAWSRSVRRAPSTTRTPFAASWRAVPSPIPLDAPVMRTTLFNPGM